MITQVFNEIENFLAGNHTLSAVEFSLLLEDFLVDNYDIMHKENAFMTEQMNENLPDICALAEPSPDTDSVNVNFAVKLREEYERLLVLS